MEFKISVVVPVFNVEAYVEECLQSIAAQTMTDGIECILVDDCGQDSSMSIVNEFTSLYSGPIVFKIITHEKNKGLSAARNSGTRYATGKYVFYLDSDDKLFPNSLKDIYSVALKYPDAEMIQGSTTPTFDLKKWGVFHEYSDDVAWIRRKLCTAGIPDPAWNRLVKRDFIIQNDLFFVEGFLQEDTIWSYQLQRCLSKIAFCFELTYWYRYNPNGIMHGNGKEREAKSFARVHDYVFYELLHCEDVKPYEIQYLEWNATRVMKLVGEDVAQQLLCNHDNKRFMNLYRLSLTRQRMYGSTTLITRVFYKLLRMTVGIVVDLICAIYRKTLCNKDTFSANVILSK